MFCAIAFRPPTKGLGSTIAPSPSPSACRRDSRAFAIAPLSLPLQLPCRARGRAVGAVFEPLGDLRERGHVDLRRSRPGEDAGDIEVRDGEAVPEQVCATGE